MSLSVMIEILYVSPCLFYFISLYLTYEVRFEELYLSIPSLSSLSLILVSSMLFEVSPSVTQSRNLGLQRARTVINK